MIINIIGSSDAPTPLQPMHHTPAHHASTIESMRIVEEIRKECFEAVRNFPPSRADNNHKTLTPTTNNFYPQEEVKQ